MAARQAFQQQQQQHPWPHVRVLQSGTQQEAVGAGGGAAAPLGHTRPVPLPLYLAAPHQTALEQVQQIAMLLTIRWAAVSAQGMATYSRSRYSSRSKGRCTCQAAHSRSSCSSSQSFRLRLVVLMQRLAVSWVSRHRLVWQQGH